MTWVDVASIAGSVGTLCFGVLSLKQSSDISALKRAVTVHAQAAYNAWWQVGMQAENSLKESGIAQLHQRAAAIAAVSQTSRSEVIAFGREHSGCAPYYEPAWQPGKVAQPTSPS